MLVSIILYVKSLNILSSICPLSMLAASLRPNETFLAKKDINSIRTSRGNKANGQPEGTNKEKNFMLCSVNPKIVDPKTILKLRKKVSIKCDVEAKLYGIIPIRLFTNINKNRQYMNG